MSAVSGLRVILFSALCLGCASCDEPGRPAPGPQAPLPEQVMEFTALYKQNCAGCHGANGKNGVAISLANPVYLAMAGQATVRQVTANGIAGTLMPAFEKSAGGTLTDRQVDILAQGIFQAWSRPNTPGALPLALYAASATGDPKQGQRTFAEFCAHCHGAGGSIVDPSYLALVSDRSLRSTIVAGRPEEGMPASRAMSDQDVADVVAWLAAERTKP